jgi:hypothetical protein
MLLTGVLGNPIAVPAGRVGVAMQSVPGSPHHPCTIVTVVDGGTMTLPDRNDSATVDTLYVKQSVSEVEQMRMHELRDLAGNRQSDAHTRFGPQ